MRHLLPPGLAGILLVAAAVVIAPPGFLRGFFLAIGLMLIGFAAANIILRLRRGPDAQLGVGARPNRSMSAAGDPYEVFDVLVEAFREDAEMRAVAVDRARLRVTARTGISWRSWGERVEGRVHAVPGGGSSIELSSAPRMPTTLADYGRGREHLDRLTRALPYLDGPAYADPGEGGVA